MESVKTYLEQAVELGAADLFLIAGRNIVMKRGGAFLDAAQERLMPKDSETLVRELYGLAHRPIPDNILVWDDDFALSLPGLARFRVNVFQQRGSLAAVIRVVKFGIPDWKEIGISEEVMNLSTLTRGLALVTGPAGSGKSTTLACIVDAINRTRAAHIITIEDPIEYLHRNQMSIVSQRELSIDTENYVTALRASLRQAPDVILLGEMRDLDTIATAMTAAETGHFVISTLHTVGAVNTIDRIIDVFPPAQQQQVRVQLSQVLRTVVSQQLLPTVDGGLAPAFEVMRLNNAIRNLVRDSRVHQIDSVIQTSAAEGMIAMDESILRLRRAGRVSTETALYFAVNPEQLQRKLPRS
ncbi:MAG: PilT/PilU family type 4a pilus ATPase [Oscillibacter sp.]|nr:PilT/PilU family type 4a pilus ATPase [Oscillibacter sp.]MBQ9616957.1 PilT/PilU family type 4a pilus ATPase [Oscillibacter sp.]